MYGYLCSRGGQANIPLQNLFIHLFIHLFILSLLPVSESIIYVSVSISIPLSKSSNSN
jgi:hypothetical protein